MREFLEKDAEGLFEMDSDPDVHKYLGNNTVKDIGEIHKLIARVQKQYIDNGIGRWAIENKVTGELMGWSGLQYETKLRKGIIYYDLGYRLLRKHWGKGIATETAIASLEYGFNSLKLDKICAAAHIGNNGSNKILRKIGMNYVDDFYWEDIKCHWYEKENPLTNKNLP